MHGERDPADSRRLSSLTAKFQDKRYRDGYVATHNRGVLARQMRNFRGKRSQSEYAAAIEKRQTVVSRLESPGYGSWTLRTMLDIARKEDVAVIVRFVDFPTFLKYSGDLSDAALHPASYDEMIIDEVAERAEVDARSESLKALFLKPDELLPPGAIEALGRRPVMAANDDNEKPLNRAEAIAKAGIGGRLGK